MQNLERKLEEERNAPNKLEEKANGKQKKQFHLHSANTSLTEKLKMEYEANTILLKHEITSKTEALDRLTKEHQKQTEACKELQHQLQEITATVSPDLNTYPDFLYFYALI